MSQWDHSLQNSVRVEGCSQSGMPRKLTLDTERLGCAGRSDALENLCASSRYHLTIRPDGPRGPCYGSDPLDHGSSGPDHGPPQSDVQVLEVVNTT